MSGFPRPPATRWRCAVPVVAAALLLAAFAGPADATPPGSPPTEDPGRTQGAAPVPRLDWGSCGPGREAFQCTTAEVPTDYDRPRGATTSISLTRLPASAPAGRIGTLFVNPGGPGGSGVDFVQQAAASIPPAIRARFDVLGFDPRGVARSDPATCFPTAEQEASFRARSLLFPLTPAEERRFVAESRELGTACATTSPGRFRHISTANVARDLDLLRQAVGDQRLSYLGLSYGTYLGATYARLFPTRVRALVLDGTIDPREYAGTRDRGLPVGARIDQGQGGAEVFQEFLRRCTAAGPARCSLAATGDPAAVARQTLDRLKTRPVNLPLPGQTTRLVTYQVAVDAAFLALHDPAAWTSLADFLAALALNDRTAAGRAGAELAARAAQTRGEDYTSIGENIGSTCVDATTPPLRVYPRVADAQDRRFPDFGRFRTWVDLPCRYLVAAGIRDADAYRGPWRQRTQARVLVIGTRWDPATPYRNTRPYAGLFPRATVVTHQGWGHVAIDQSVCALALTSAYLADPDQPRPDQTCPTDVVPFAAPADRSRERRPPATAPLLRR